MAAATPANPISADPACAKFVNLFVGVIEEMHLNRRHVGVDRHDVVGQIAVDWRTALRVAAAMNALTEYHWPGNVRELENFTDRAVILSRGSKLEPPLAELAKQKKPPSAGSADNSATLEETEREHIVRALKQTKWVVGGPAGAAARLGMKRTTLNSLMKRLGINRPR
jgi:transcriptional regulator with GAF, ATPase, and Fis domain